MKAIGHEHQRTGAGIAHITIGTQKTAINKIAERAKLIAVNKPSINDAGDKGIRLDPICLRRSICEWLV